MSVIGNCQTVSILLGESGRIWDTWNNGTQNLMNILVYLKLSSRQEFSDAFHVSKGPAFALRKKKLGQFD